MIKKENGECVGMIGDRFLKFQGFHDFFSSFILFERRKWKYFVLILNGVWYTMANRRLKQFETSVGYSPARSTVECISLHVFWSFSVEQVFKRIFLALDLLDFEDFFSER